MPAKDGLLDAIDNIYVQGAAKKKARNLLKKYYLLAQEPSPPKKLWSSLYDEGAMGKNIHKAITNYLVDKSGKCCYCQDKIYHNANVNIEHILARTDYPQFTFTPANLATICLTCNALKGSIDFFKLNKLQKRYRQHYKNLACFHPNAHDFNDHIQMFCLQTNYVYVRTYVGKTKEGRNLCLLHLNKLTHFGTKAAANPTVAGTITKLQNYVSNHELTNKPALQAMLQQLISHI